MTKFRAEAPFPQAGEGAFFRFSVSDIISLEETYGVGEYFEHIHLGVNNQSASVIKSCVENGLKKRDGDGKAVPLSLDLDQIEFPLSDFFQPIMDALCLQATGMTYLEYLEEVMKLEAERDEAMEKLDKGGKEPDPFPASEESSE